MDKYVVPTKDEIIEYVKKHDRRIGLRMLYQRYHIPESERFKYRKLWRAFMEILPDAHGREELNASRNRETEKDDGDSGTSAEEAVQTEPEGSEDVEKATA